MPETRTIVQRLRQLEIDVKNIGDPHVDPIPRILERLNRIESELFGCLDDDDFVLESEDGFDEEVDTLYVVRMKFAGQTLYLRSDPLKTVGRRKWWSTNKDDACSFVSISDAKNMMDSVGVSWKASNIEFIDRDVIDKKKGWIIIDPNPPNCKGTAHYFTDNGDADEEDADDWSGLKDKAKVFEKKNVALATAKRLVKEGDVHFKSELPKNRLIVRSI